MKEGQYRTNNIGHHPLKISIISIPQLIPNLQFFVIYYNSSILSQTSVSHSNILIHIFYILILLCYNFISPFPFPFPFFYNKSKILMQESQRLLVSPLPLNSSLWNRQVLPPSVWRTRQPLWWGTRIKLIGVFYLLYLLYKYQYLYNIIKSVRLKFGSWLFVGSDLFIL